jgi:type IV secretion system protein VirD4
MDLDGIVQVVDSQMPVCAKRIKYYEDRFFKQIFDKQTGDLQYPSASEQIRGLQGQIKAPEAKVGALAGPAAGSDLRGTGGNGGMHRAEIEALYARGEPVPRYGTVDAVAYREGNRRLEQFLKETHQK